jgi:HEAT repeat protein
MQKAVEARKVETAREAIRALGRLARPEATQPLADLLLSKSLLARRRLRELKVAAASALGRIPGDDAVGALAQAARSRDRQLRRAAQTALDRRGQALSGA